MTKVIVGSLVSCVLLGAFGGFGAPLLCKVGDKDCAARWQQAASGALTASGALGTLLARHIGSDPEP